MTFKLEIELGNDAMQSAYDVALALSEAVRQLTLHRGYSEPLQHEEQGSIRDVNGNRVGSWEVG